MNTLILILALIGADVDPADVREQLLAANIAEKELIQKKIEHLKIEQKVIRVKQKDALLPFYNGVRKQKLKQLQVDLNDNVAEIDALRADLRAYDEGEKQALPPFPFGQEAVGRFGIGERRGGQRLVVSQILGPQEFIARFEFTALHSRTRSPQRYVIRGIETRDLADEKQLAFDGCWIVADRVTLGGRSMFVLERFSPMAYMRD